MGRSLDFEGMDVDVWPEKIQTSPSSNNLLMIGVALQSSPDRCRAFLQAVDRVPIPSGSLRAAAAAAENILFEIAHRSPDSADEQPVYFRPRTHDAWLKLLTSAPGWGLVMLGAHVRESPDECSAFLKLSGSDDVSVPESLRHARDALYDVAQLHGRPNAHQARHRRPRRPPAIHLYGRAAGILALVVLIVSVSMKVGEFSRAGESGWTEYSTQIGEVRRVNLPDGTTLDLNTDTRVQIRYSESLRLIKLPTGEARFNVTHDGKRPFVVLASDTVVRDLGTEFTVRVKENRRTEVRVIGGAVAVSNQVPRAKLEKLLRGVMVPLLGETPVHAGTAAAVARSGNWTFASVAPRELEDRDEWRNGVVVFNGSTFFEVAEELNRHNARRIEIADPVLRAVKVSGRFRTSDVDAVLKGMHLIVPITIVDTVDRAGDARIVRVYRASDARRFNDP